MNGCLIFALILLLVHNICAVQYGEENDENEISQQENLKNIFEQHDVNDWLSVNPKFLLRKQLEILQKYYKDLNGNKDKRALTMLARWKPFRMALSGNGRHVIRSPFMQDSNQPNRIRPFGQPLRWGR